MPNTLITIIAETPAIQGNTIDTEIVTTLPAESVIVVTTTLE